MGEKAPTCARWHDQWVKGMVGKTTIPMTQTEVESGDLMKCVLRDIGGASGYSKTN